MASAVGSGTSFYGLPVHQGKVLYIEVDTPLQALHERIKITTPPPKNVWFLHMQPLSIPFLDKEGDQAQMLREAQEEICPDVVFINTLRKVHDLDDKDSKTPKIVYSFFQERFPQAALVFIHHEKKRPTDPKAIVWEMDTFSGAKNWINDAQTGLHLETYTPSKDHPENLKLYHRKSQVSRKLRALPLILGEDGTTLTSPLYTELLTVYEWMNTTGAEMSASEADTALARLLDTSVTTAKRRRLLIQNGDFPGSRRFLEGRDSD